MASRMVTTENKNHIFMLAKNAFICLQVKAGVWSFGIIWQNFHNNLWAYCNWSGLRKLDSCSSPSALFSGFKKSSHDKKFKPITESYWLFCSWLACTFLPMMKAWFNGRKPLWKISNTTFAYNVVWYKILYVYEQVLTPHEALARINKKQRGTTNSEEQLLNEQWCVWWTSHSAFAEAVEKDVWTILSVSHHCSCLWSLGHDAEGMQSASGASLRRWITARATGS